MISLNRRGWILLLLFSSYLMAQSGASYKIEQGTFNNSGNPPPELASPLYRVILSSLGEEINAVGMASTSYNADAGFPSGFPPPGEVLNLRFADAATLTWNPLSSACTYVLYRGDRTGLPLDYGTPVQSEIETTMTADPSTPDPGHCLIYLVTAVNRLNVEGIKGYTSSGTPRP